MPDLDEHDLSFISSEKTREYIKYLSKNQGVSQNKLEEINEDQTIDADLKTLLNNLLQLNPYFRWSPRECLRLSTFDDFRCQELENIKGTKIKLAVDQDQVYDYEKNESILFDSKD